MSSVDEEEMVIVEPAASLTSTTEEDVVKQLEAYKEAKRARVDVGVNTSPALSGDAGPDLQFAASALDATVQGLAPILEEVERCHPFEVLTSKQLVPLEGSAASGTLDALVNIPKAFIEKHAAGKVGLVVMLDVSGSMDGNPMETMKAAVEKLPAMLESKHGVEIETAMGTFSDTAQIFNERFEKDGRDTGKQPFSKLNLAAAKNVALRLKTDRATNIEAAIEAAAGVFLDEMPDEPPLKHVVLLTDGNPTRGECIPELLDRKIKQTFCQPGAEQFVVSVLCLGSNIDRAVAKALTNATGGIVAHARDTTELAEAMGAIFGPITETSKALTICVGGEYTKKCGLLTLDNRRTLVTVEAPAKDVAGRQEATTVELLGIAAAPAHFSKSVILDYVDKEKLAALGANADPVPRMLQDELDAVQMRDERNREFEAALIKEGMATAAKVSRTYTERAAQRFGADAPSIHRFRMHSDRTERMAEADAELETQLATGGGEDGVVYRSLGGPTPTASAQLTSDALSSQYC